MNIKYILFLSSLVNLLWVKNVCRGKTGPESHGNTLCPCHAHTAHPVLIVEVLIREEKRSLSMMGGVEKAAGCTK